MVVGKGNCSSTLLLRFQTLGTAACPPYHLAIVIGGTSAEFALKVVKLASTKYLDTLPTSGKLSLLCGIIVSIAMLNHGYDQVLVGNIPPRSLLKQIKTKLDN